MQNSKRICFISTYAFWIEVLVLTIFVVRSSQGRMTLPRGVRDGGRWWRSLRGEVEVWALERTEDRGGEEEEMPIPHEVGLLPSCDQYALLSAHFNQEDSWSSLAAAEIKSWMFLQICFLFVCNRALLFRGILHHAVKKRVGIWLSLFLAILPKKVSCLFAIWFWTEGMWQKRTRKELFVMSLSITLVMVMLSILWMLWWKKAWSFCKRVSRSATFSYPHNNMFTGMAQKIKYLLRVLTAGSDQ